MPHHLTTTAAVGKISTFLHHQPVGHQVGALLHGDPDLNVEAISAHLPGPLAISPDVNRGMIELQRYLRQHPEGGPTQAQAASAETISPIEGREEFMFETLGAERAPTCLLREDDFSLTA